VGTYIEHRDLMDGGVTAAYWYDDLTEVRSHKLLQRH